MLWPQRQRPQDRQDKIPLSPETLLTPLTLLTTVKALSLGGNKGGSP
jgi:hypothetical protein